MTDFPTPPIIKAEDDDHKYAEDPITGIRIPGVTTIGGLIDKPWLPRWAANQAAEYAVDNVHEIVRLMIAGKTREAEHLIGGTSYRYTRETSELGKRVHKLYERLASGEEIGWVPEEMSPFLGNWEKFIAEYHPTFVDTEFHLWNPEVGYFGTADWAAVIDGQLLLGDTKSGAGVYDSVALQLSAYLNAPYILRRVGEEVTVEANRVYEGAVVLHTRPEGWSLHPIDTGPEVFDRFKALAAHIMPWVGWKGRPGDGKYVVGKPENALPYKKPAKAPRYPK